MNKNKTYQGIFKGHKVGYGFVKSLNGDYGSDIFIPKNSTAHAIEGDLVEVEVTATDSPKGWEGKVNAILERKHDLLGGIVTEILHNRAIILCPLLGLNKEVSIPLKKKMDLRVGDRIRVQLKKWKSEKKNVEGEFKEYIGNIKDPSCDVEASIHDFVLREKFPPRVLKELESLPKQVIPKDYPDREDLQDLNAITIDPKTAKDFDDAISIKKHANGKWTLGVHIADVSYFVREGTALDQEASMRSNSTYFPGYCVPMLPPALSDDLCSLKPNVPRLAVSTLMELDQNGQLETMRYTRSIINSKKRFTYEEVKEILDGKRKSPFATQLKELEELALLLKKIRRDRGCLDLALADTNVIVDKAGVPKRIEIIEYDITHQMIEEFMLKNNEVIAKYLSDKGVTIPFRIHEKPKSDNLNDFVYIADSMGFKVSNPPLQKELQDLFDEIKGTSNEHQLAVAFIKCMKLATYNIENQGHYGLQLEYYCHFTSPIRRYIDLVIHRQLFGESKSTNFKLIAERCSDAERLSAKAETATRTLKILRLLDFENKKKKKTYKGIVTKVKPFGLFFELPDLLLEGFIHISKIGPDYYVFNEKKGVIRGEDTKELFKIGQPLKVKIVDICLITLEVEWRRCY